MRKVIDFIKDNKQTVMFAVVFMIITVLSAFWGNTLLFAVCTLTLIACLVYGAVSAVSKLKDKRNEPSDDVRELLKDATGTIDQPMMILDDEDTIVWLNKCLSSVVSDTRLSVGQSVKGLFGGALRYSVLKSKRETLVVEVNSKFYKVTATERATRSKSHYLTVWSDVTAQYHAEQTLKNKNIVIGYAAIDNAAEVASYLQEQYRSMIGKAYSELYAWVNDMNGIIREYDRDKYIIFVDYENFIPNEEKKFDILERIDAAISGDSNRVTLSMGFAVLDGTLSEKEEGAREALEYAFQRGGAQIVVKNNNSTTSYGGQNKAGAKTTKIKSRVTADRLKALIADSDNVLIMGHKNIDADAFGSACAVARLTLTLKKKVNIIVDVNSKEFLELRPYVDELQDYENIFIDHVSGQEELTPRTLLVIVDVNNPKVFESIDIYNNAHKVAIIDHHVQTITYDVAPTLQYIDPTASSASELMGEILEQAIPRNAIKSAEAELLLAGILLDTKQLTRNIGVRTFGVTMFLHADNKMMSRARSLFSPSIDKYIKLSSFRKNTSLFRDIIGISYYDGDALPENRVIASISADEMIEIENVRASFALCTIGDDIHISGRSDGSINVAKILEYLGGGGRFEAAATLMKATSMTDALSKLRVAINTTWD